MSIDWRVVCDLRKVPVDPIEIWTLAVVPVGMFLLVFLALLWTKLSGAEKMIYPILFAIMTGFVSWDYVLWANANLGRQEIVAVDASITGKKSISSRGNRKGYTLYLKLIGGRQNAVRELKVSGETYERMRVGDRVKGDYRRGGLGIVYRERGSGSLIFIK